MKHDGKVSGEVMERLNKQRRQISSKVGHKKIKYISTKDCLSEPELIKAYCALHSQAACIGGYAHMGCRPEKSRLEQFIKYDCTKGCYVKADGTTVPSDETYCGRKIPSRTWNGKMYKENQIWNLARLGMPDLKDHDMIIEAKGGLPTLSKVHTALGQLLMYRAHDPNLKLGFLFPKIWLQAECIQIALSVVQGNGITLIPL
ncbi:MAG: hypothetical protein NTV10_00215 [Methanoregula sp.]|nr:hypothetical protein [Methanoregula sp.]